MISDHLEYYFVSRDFSLSIILSPSTNNAQEEMIYCHTSFERKRLKKNSPSLISGAKNTITTNHKSNQRNKEKSKLFINEMI